MIKKQTPIKPPPVAMIYFGDQQVGSDAGIAVPDYPLKSKKKSQETDTLHRNNPDQQWLYETFTQQALPEIKEITKTHYSILCLGGDVIDGAGHHGSTETFGTPGDQRDMATALLKPLVDMCDIAYGVTGTVAHVQDNGDDDRSVYAELGIITAPVWKLRISGRLIYWSHHGIGVGKLAWTDVNPLVQIAKNIRSVADRNRAEIPALRIAHDRHVSPEPVYVNGVWCGVVPCWQLQTYYAHSVAALSNSSIGYMVYYPDTNLLVRRVYEVPEKITTVTTNRSNRIIR